MCARLGYRSKKGLNWEQNIIVLHKNFREKTSETSRLIQEYAAIVTLYSWEFQKFQLELSEACRVEKIDRETIAKRVEFCFYVISASLGVCVPVIIGIIATNFLYQQ